MAFVIFLSAFLLFQVQPMMGRFVLPWFGGGPAVWTACLLFFQTLLLAGYGYAHWLGRRQSGRSNSYNSKAWVHVGLLAGSLAFLPVGPRAEWWRPLLSTHPVGRILVVLAATVGGPYLMLASTGPLLQRWHTWREPGRSPWRLYALSNAGSLLALVSYPFAIEPYVRLHVQAGTWSVLYTLFAAMCGWTAWRMREVAAPAVVEEEAASGVGVWTVLFWMGLAACGSTLLMATTNQVSQEIASNPFLWVAPLAVYLLTFILTFERQSFYRPALFACLAGIFAPLGCMVQSAAITQSLGMQMAMYVLVLFIGCVLCHGELARSRPAASGLTGFYLAVAAGGAVGGLFVAVIAPKVFTRLNEYPIGLAAACALGFVGWVRTGALRQWTGGNFAVRLPLMALLTGAVSAMVAAGMAGNPNDIVRLRNFYGVLRVRQDVDGNGRKRDLMHGRILHGMQYGEMPQRTWPTTYYGAHSGVGIAFQAMGARPRRVGLIGLGTGTMAAWGREGDTFRFYEINPVVETIARSWFTYLADSKAKTEVVLGDARVQMERELAGGRSHDLDAIVVDGFSGDAIPVHLLTAECGDLYKARLAPGGILLLHISNQVLDLEPVARGLAEHMGWPAVQYISSHDDVTGESRSQWVLISSDAEFLKRPEVSIPTSAWGLAHPRPLVWTDDFASLWHVLMW